MRYDQLILKATIALGITWALVRTADHLIDNHLTAHYWRRVKGTR
ncbi:hypothetical protein AB0300_18755 [Microbacterium sp. NPDC078814]